MQFSAYPQSVTVHGPHGCARYWVQLGYTAAAAVALALLIWNPRDNLAAALPLLGVAAGVLYGVALWRWWKRKK